MDIFGLGSVVYDSRFQPFAQRLSSLEERVKDVQTKLFICQDDIKDSNQPGIYHSSKVVNLSLHCVLH